MACLCSPDNSPMGPVAALQYDLALKISVSVICVSHGTCCTLVGKDQVQCVTSTGHGVRLWAFI